MSEARDTPKRRVTFAYHRPRLRRRWYLTRARSGTRRLWMIQWTFGVVHVYF